MRYLKLFNESNSDPYKEINGEEYNRLMEGDIVKLDKILSDKERNIIKEMFPECLIHLSKSWKQIEISISSKYKFILLDRNSDEWYLIRYQNLRKVADFWEQARLGGYFDSFYKCDQFDGLIKLLEEIL